MALDHALSKEDALAGQAPVCLLLCDSRQVSVAEAKAQLEQILQDMKVPAEAADLADTAPEALPAFENYETISSLFLSDNFYKILDHRFSIWCHNRFRMKL